MYFAYSAHDVGSLRSSFSLVMKTSSARHCWHCRTTGIYEVLLSWKISVCMYPNCRVVKGALGKHRDFGDYTERCVFCFHLINGRSFSRPFKHAVLSSTSFHTHFSSEKHRVPLPFFCFSLAAQIHLHTSQFLRRKDIEREKGREKD